MPWEGHDTYTHFGLLSCWNEPPAFSKECVPVEGKCIYLTDIKRSLPYKVPTTNINNWTDFITSDNYGMGYHDCPIYTNNALVGPLLLYGIMVVMIVFCTQVIVAKGL